MPEPPRSGQARLLEAVRSSKRTSGFTHNFYRYPARFSAEFAREAIRYFTKKNDVVLDPFMGGGTTAVEALALGRRFIGNDINQLAHFVTSAKSTAISTGDERAIAAWASQLPALVHLHRPEPADDYGQAYKRHVPWQLRKTISQAMASLETLSTERQRSFARCSLLNTAQWALDCKASVPSKEEFLLHHAGALSEMLAGMQQYRTELNRFGITIRGVNSRRLLISSSADKLHEWKSAKTLGAPRLLLTSPPYLGVHVLYHRWQIQGRRETSAPYWIAGKSDGHTGVYYTFADRRATAVEKYMSKLKACFQSAIHLLDKRSHVVQLVAFSNAEIQMPAYLRALDEAGLQSCDVFQEVAGSTQVERVVPNRRWYALTSKQSNSSKEFLLVHRPKSRG